MHRPGTWIWTGCFCHPCAVPCLAWVGIPGARGSAGPLEPRAITWRPPCAPGGCGAGEGGKSGPGAHRLRPRSLPLSPFPFLPFFLLPLPVPIHPSIPTRCLQPLLCTYHCGIHKMPAADEGFLPFLPALMISFFLLLLLLPSPLLSPPPVLLAPSLPPPFWPPSPFAVHWVLLPCRIQPCPWVGWGGRLMPTTLGAPSRERGRLLCSQDKLRHFSAQKLNEGAGTDGPRERSPTLLRASQC